MEVFKKFILSSCNFVCFLIYFIFFIYVYNLNVFYYIISTKYHYIFMNYFYKTMSTNRKFNNTYILIENKKRKKEKKIF